MKYLFNMTEEEIKEVKDDSDIVDVISLFTELKRKGAVYVGLCPHHTDKTVGSFKVNPKNQTYRCYSCMEESGDVLDFLKKTGKTFKEAISILKGEVEVEGTVLTKTERNKVQLAEFKYIEPPTKFSQDSFIHSKYGNPTQTYPYISKDHKLLGYVLRYEDSEGKKVILPLNFGECISPGWEYEYQGKGKGKYYGKGQVVEKYLGFGSNRPIFGADKVLENPNANIIISEGEKCANFIQNRYKPKQVVSLTWQGGTGSINLVDWSLLTGRRVFLFRDNDEASLKAFTTLVETLKGYDCEVNWIDLPSDDHLPDSWDVADTSWNTQQLTQHIKENSKLI